jgi:hypothetical protein
MVIDDRTGACRRRSCDGAAIRAEIRPFLPEKARDAPPRAATILVGRATTASLSEGQASCKSLPLKGSSWSRGVVRQFRHARCFVREIG